MAERLQLCILGTALLLVSGCSYDMEVREASRAGRCYDAERLAKKTFAAYPRAQQLAIAADCFEQQGATAISDRLVEDARGVSRGGAREYYAVRDSRWRQEREEKVRERERREYEQQVAQARSERDALQQIPNTVGVDWNYSSTDIHGCAAYEEYMSAHYIVIYNHCPMDIYLAEKSFFHSRRHFIEINCYPARLGPGKVGKFYTGKDERGVEWSAHLFDLSASEEEVESICYTWCRMQDCPFTRMNWGLDEQDWR